MMMLILATASFILVGGPEVDCSELLQALGCLIPDTSCLPEVAWQAGSEDPGVKVQVVISDYNSNPPLDVPFSGECRNERFVVVDPSKLPRSTDILTLFARLSGPHWAKMDLQLVRAKAFRDQDGLINHFGGIAMATASKTKASWKYTIQGSACGGFATCSAESKWKNIKSSAFKIRGGKSTAEQVDRPSRTKTGP